MSGLSEEAIRLLLSLPDSALIGLAFVLLFLTERGCGALMLTWKGKRSHVEIKLGTPEKTTRQDKSDEEAR